MHELEKIKRAQVQQVDEMSIQNLIRENHKTIQQLARRMGSQGMAVTDGGELARTLLVSGWHMQGEKGELKSCRGTVQLAWQKTFS